MSAKRISLDTNLLFYAIDRDSGERHERAMEIVKQAALQHDCILTLQVLCEFFAATTRKGRMTIEEATAQVNDWQTLFAIVHATSVSFQRAMKAVAQHRLAFWDAMIWSVAREAGVTLLLSEDFQHDRVLEGVRFRNPFLVDNPFE